MTQGQSFTCATIALAAAIAVAGIALAVVTLALPDFHTRLNELAGTRLPKEWLAPIVLISGFMAATAIVSAQQHITSWLVAREMRKLHATYREIEAALGTEKATEFLQYKLKEIQMAQGKSGSRLF